jgi:hypothetical protein
MKDKHLFQPNTTLIADYRKLPDLRIVADARTCLCGHNRQAHKATFFSEGDMMCTAMCGCRKWAPVPEELLPSP